MSSINSESDEALVSAAKKGNDLAFETLFRRYSTTIKKISANYFIFGADEGDIFQEGLVGLFRAVIDFSTEKNVSFSTFAYICITGSIISAVKRASRKKHMPLNDYISLDYSFDNEKSSIDYVPISRNQSNNPETLFIDKETIKSVRAFIDKNLSDFEKKVFSLYLDNKSYQQIAEDAGRSVKSVDNAIQRVKRKLMAAL